MLCFAPWINCSLCCVEAIAQAVGYASFEWLWERWVGCPAYADAHREHAPAPASTLGSDIGTGTPSALIIGTDYDLDYTQFLVSALEECQRRIRTLESDIDFAAVVDTVATLAEVSEAALADVADEQRIFEEECTRLYVAGHDTLHGAVVYDDAHREADRPTPALTRKSVNSS